ncbi:MAG: aldo/keto reductase [Miltoncostaeaceae bacterium]
MRADAAGTLAVGDIEVARLGFGALRLTGEGGLGEPSDVARAVGVVRRAVELGVTLIDTADSYGPEVSERLIAKALHPYPPELLIATKGGLVHSPERRWARDGRPERLRAACEGSLRRLRLDRIDLYQLHAPDPDVPIEESLGAIADMVDEGKVRHVGVCNVSVEELARARSVLPIVTVQNRYNLRERGSDAVIDICERDGIPFMPWYPLSRGLLGSRDGGPLGRVAEHRGVSPARIAIAWLLARSPMMLPIPGTSRVRHLDDNVAAAGIRLDPDELESLSGGAALSPGP